MQNTQFFAENTLDKSHLKNASLKNMPPLTDFQIPFTLPTTAYREQGLTVPVFLP